MAMQTKTDGLGIDVGKDWLDIFNGDTVERVENTQKAIRAYLKLLPTPVPIAIEATNVYHELFIQLALAADTDGVDARLLYRYLNAERTHLRPYEPPSKAVKRLMRLLKARAKLAHSKASLKLSLAGIGELVQTKKALMARFDKAIAVIDKKLIDCINESGYTADYKRCQTIKGVGPINAAALVAFYHRGDFRKADSFVSFMGLDVRVRESGRYRGQRKLTKKGNPEIRRLLFNAARAGAKTTQWKPYYESLRERGLTTTAAAVAISRKIAKLAFALMRDQTEYQVKVA